MSCIRPSTDRTSLSARDPMAIMFSRPPREGAGCGEDPAGALSPVVALRRTTPCRPRRSAGRPPSLPRWCWSRPSCVTTSAVPVAAKPASGAAALRQMIASGRRAEGAAEPRRRERQRGQGRARPPAGSRRHGAGRGRRRPLRGRGRRRRGDRPRPSASPSSRPRASAARAALVDRAIDLYEHPYQLAEALLSGTEHAPGPHRPPGPRRRGAGPHQRSRRRGAPRADPAARRVARPRRRPGGRGRRAAPGVDGRVRPPADRTRLPAAGARRAGRRGSTTTTPSSPCSNPRSRSSSR